jgi:hypothetical protein
VESDTSASSSTPTVEPETYVIKVVAPTGVTYTLNKQRAAKGEEVVLTITELSSAMSVKEVTMNGSVLSGNDGAYSFTMPDRSVTIKISVVVEGDVTLIGDIAAALELGQDGIYVARNIKVEGSGFAYFSYCLTGGDGKKTVLDSLDLDEFRCFANVTTSLCSPDAVESFRYAVVDLEADPVVACMLASDGVEDSFPSMELMIAYCRELLAYAAEHGVEALNAHLNETLPDFSRTGSGDDVTLCGVIDPERAAEFNEVYERQNAVVRQQGVVADLEARMDSMRGMGKLDALKARYEDARQRAEQARDDLTAAQGALDAYSDDLMKLEEAEAREPETVLAITRVIR